jgi:hypothetical protein
MPLKGRDVRLADVQPAAAALANSAGCGATMPKTLLGLL